MKVKDMGLTHTAVVKRQKPQKKNHTHQKPNVTGQFFPRATLSSSSCVKCHTPVSKIHLSFKSSSVSHLFHKACLQPIKLILCLDSLEHHII